MPVANRSRLPGAHCTTRVERKISNPTDNVLLMMIVL
jgi:hypothetical protein